MAGSSESGCVAKVQQIKEKIRSNALRKEKGKEKQRMEGIMEWHDLISA
jgi:hypothetical protein